MSDFIQGVIEKLENSSKAREAVMEAICRGPGKPEGVGWIMYPHPTKEGKHLRLGSGGAVLDCHSGPFGGSVLHALARSMELPDATGHNAFEAAKRAAEILGMPVDDLYFVKKDLEELRSRRAKSRTAPHDPEALSPIKRLDDLRGLTTHQLKPDVVWEYPSGLFVIRSNDPKRFSQAWRDPSGGYVWKRPEGAPTCPMGYFGASPENAQGIMVHEGEKAGEAGAKLLPTWCHVVVAGGASSLRKADWRPVKRVGLHVYLVPDADEAGREAMDVAGQKLAGLGAAVLWLDLFGDDSKRDVADFEGNLEERIQTAVKLKEPAVESDEESDPRPGLFLAKDLSEDKGECLRFLTQTPGLYQRSGRLCVIDEVQDDPKGRRIPKIALVEHPRLAGILSSKARFFKVKKNGEGEPTYPPTDLLKALLEIGEWPSEIPLLKGLTSTPILRSDGSIFTGDGYDPETGFALKAGTIAWPAFPSDPLSIFEEMLMDFAWESENDKSAAVAMLLTALAFPAFQGPSPMFLITAPKPGSGKTLLANLSGIIAYGKEPPPLVYGTSEENAKLLTALAKEGAPIAFFDNVRGSIGRDSGLELAITSTQGGGRILGSSATICCDWRPLWLSTGNSVVISSEDMARRIVPIRLKVYDGIERPEERTGFRHDPLMEWVREQRPELVMAALALLRNRIVNRDEKVGPKLGTFQGWADLVCGAIIQAGLPNPLGHRECLRENSTDASELETLHALLDNETGWVTAGDILNNRSDTSRELLALLPAPRGKEFPSAKGLTMLLSKYTGNPLRGRKIRKKMGKGGQTLFSLEPCQPRNDNPETLQGEDGLGCTTFSFARAKNLSSNLAPEKTVELGKKISYPNPSSPSSLDVPPCEDRSLVDNRVRVPQ
jgi:hypothetical protein